MSEIDTFYVREMAYLTYFRKLLTPLRAIYRYLNEEDKAAYDDLANAVDRLEMLMKQQPKTIGLATTFKQSTDDGIVEIWIADHSAWSTHVRECRDAATKLRHTCLFFDYPVMFMHSLCANEIMINGRLWSLHSVSQADLELFRDWTKLSEAIATHFAAKDANKTTTCCAEDTAEWASEPCPCSGCSTKDCAPKESAIVNFTAADARALTAKAEESKKQLQSQIEALHAEIIEKVKSAAQQAQYELPLGFLGERSNDFWKAFATFYENNGCWPSDAQADGCQQAEGRQSRADGYELRLDNDGYKLSWRPAKRTEDR